jgi:site-specific recombinase XerD
MAARNTGGGEVAKLRAVESEHAKLADLVPSWERSLRAANKSARTIRAYGDSGRLLEAFLVEQGLPTAVNQITREHIEMFMTDQLARHKPTTASVRFRSLQQLFKWLLEEE